MPFDEIEWIDHQIGFNQGDHQTNGVRIATGESSTRTQKLVHVLECAQCKGRARMKRGNPFARIRRFFRGGCIQSSGHASTPR